MRFHMGVSFRFKTLKKLLIPFLIGFLSYFGFSYFNILVVNAVANVNLDTYYIFDVPQMDYDNFETHGHKIIDLVEEFKSYNEYYNIVANISVNRTTLNPSLNISIIPQNITYGDYRIYIQNGNSTGDIYFSFSISENFHYYTLSATGTDSTFNTTYNYIKSCLQNNSCTGSTYSSYYTSSVGRPKADNNSNYDLTTNSVAFQFVYYSDIEIKYSLPTSTSSSLYYKALNYFGENKQPGDTIKSYYDILHPSDDSSSWSIVDLKHIDDVFVSKVDKSNISNLNVDISFKYYDDLLPVDLDYQTSYYGRINHGNYYSYEQINCLRDGAITYDSDINNNYKVSYSNFRCSSDLTNYDYIYIRFRPYYKNVNNPNISNTLLVSNYGYISQIKQSNGGNFIHLVEYFDDLPINFNLLVSSSSENANVGYYSEYSSIVMSSVNRNGNVISDFANYGNISFGTYNNTNVIIYNIDLELNDINPLYVYISDDNIISIKDSNNNFTYYDETNTLVQGNINNKYQVAYNNYDLSYYFSKVNDFIDNIDNDLLSFHNLIQTCYDSLDVSIQLIINILYILGLSYLLFKALRK